MPTWKQTVLVSASFGAGFALAASFVVGVVAWYRFRPQPWNTRALKANFATMELDTQPSKENFVMKFMYDVQNNTTKNYQLSSDDLTTMAILSDGKVLSKEFGSDQASDAVIEGPPFIPPQAKARILLQILYQYPPEFTVQDKADLHKVVLVANRRLKELDGFVIFDHRNHYRIDLPEGWENLPTDRIEK